MRARQRYKDSDTKIRTDGSLPYPELAPRIVRSGFTRQIVLEEHRYVTLLGAGTFPSTPLDRGLGAMDTNKTVDGSTVLSVGVKDDTHIECHSRDRNE